MSALILLGVDPGALGAMCAMRIPNAGAPEIVFMDNKTNIKEKDAWLKQLVAEGITMAMIEKVHSIPGSSSGASFTFGWNTGEIHTLFKLNNIAYDLVTPKTWQSKMGITVPKDIKGAARKKRIKNMVAETCDRVYPGCDIYGPKGGLNDGRSDALLITAYTRFLYANGR